MSTTPTLKRSLGTTLLVLYGLGNILGAGIYVLIGEVAGVAGYLAPLAFAVAALAVSFTAFSYAELAARFPLCGGEAIYLHEAFGRAWLSRLVGLLIGLAGMVSAATIANGFTGYLRVFVDLPDAIALPLLLFALGGLAAWGISQAVWVAAAITVLEVGGLLLVLVAGSDSLATLPERWPELLPDAAVQWPAVMLAAFLAFYAFIGFEDMVNVAEEVVDPQHSMPRAIVIALLISTVLYAAVALVAVLSLPPEQLAGSEAPLAMVYEAATGERAWLLSGISLFAVVNGALIQMIMASRLFYGMARKGWLPALLGTIHQGTRTPLIATALVTAIVLLLALGFDLVALASLTSGLILLVFALVNVALLKIRRGAPAPPGVRSYPLWVPCCGLLFSIALLAAQLLG